MPRMRKMLPAELPEPDDRPALLADSYLSGETGAHLCSGPTASGKTRYAVNLAHHYLFLKSFRRPVRFIEVWT